MTAFQSYYVPQYRTTTLDVVGGLDNSQTTGIKLLAIPSDVNIAKPGILALTYANPVNTTTVEWVTYTSIDGTNVLQGVTRGAEGWSAKTHDNGCTIAWVFSKSHVNQLMDAATGVTTGVKLNTPKVVTQIEDTNGNELLKVTATASAVNELTLANAATGNDPVVSATGGDTDVGIKLTPKGAGEVQITANDLVIPTGANIQVNNADPKRAFYIPANGMFGATTNGAATGQGESTTNKVNYKVLDFDASTEEYACFSIPAPLYWDLSTVTVQFFWTAASSSGDVIWACQGLSLSNDDALDTAYGTAVTVTDTLIATGDVHVTSATSAMTLAGTPAANDQLFFRVYRDADAGGDTLAADARLIGIRVEFGISKYNDIA